MSYGLSAAARRQLQRLADFVDRFAGCFGRDKHVGVCRRYVTGLLSASERKSIQAMVGGRSDGEYQRIHHFIAHSPWDDRALWKRLREELPDRQGVLVVDDTGFHKQGPHSVGVARQYCPPLGKVANCQVAVTTVLRSRVSTWPLAMDLFLPEAWETDEPRRDRAFVPRRIQHRKKWQLALAQIDRAKREGFEIDGVAADAGYGDVSDFRSGLSRLGLDYVVRVSGSQIVFEGEPRFAKRRTPEGFPRFEIPRGAPRPQAIKKLASRIPDDRFRTIVWGKGAKGRLAIRAVAVRVRLGQDWRRGARPSARCWLLVRRKEDGSHKFYLSNLPEHAKLIDLVRIAYSRWAVEQNYQQLKDELGFDHYEGRSWPGWNHHAVLTAMAFVFLGLERRRSRAAPLPTIPMARKALSRLAQAISVIEDREMRELVASFGRDPPSF